MVRPVEDYTRVDDALAGVKSKVRVPQTSVQVETVACYGRIPAEDFMAPRDLPPFPTSHMDGYAVRAVDLKGATVNTPAILKIVGQSLLGEAPRKSLGPGEAVKVATGSGVPTGADTVVRLELAKESGSSLVVMSELKKGTHVYCRGDDVRQGEVILTMGRPIRAQDIGILLALSVMKVKVRDQLKVAVIATGSELTDATDFAEGRLRDSHSPVFLQLVRVLGCLPISMGIVEDERVLVESRLRKALAQSDLVLTLGGTSVGGHDVVGDAVSSLGPDVLYHGIKMDRGRVTGIAVVRRKPILMMPGPIQGAMNAFLLLGLPLIRYLGGMKESELKIHGKLAGTWRARAGFNGFRKVVYVRLRREKENSVVVEPLSGETESMKVLHDADGYLVVDEEVATLTSGTRVEVSLLTGFSST